jgi:FlaA1/EpsC-like NDP-sugar epimerase
MNPATIVLLEHSEYALYKIQNELTEKLTELRSRQSRHPEQIYEPIIFCILGSVDDEKLLRQTMRTHGIETIYHAAAYKHIPILEENIIAALRNNTIATEILARVARECGVGRFVLISSDKAVRPANIKGASNRLQEIILQAMALEYSNDTIFTSVRFGNVLDSSGSVVPRFRDQIKKGGPITITHPDIIRYFMSIPEAAQLVVQAGAMADSGEIYVLDMGEPVKIDDLARTMVRLSGKEVADKNSPDGDIELRYTGLRPGDKMHEELLIQGDIVGTQHPHIMRAKEKPAYQYHEMLDMVERFRTAINKSDHAGILALDEQFVEGYSPRATLMLPTTSSAIEED